MRIYSNKCYIPFTETRRLRNFFLEGEPIEIFKFSIRERLLIACASLSIQETMLCGILTTGLDFIAFNDGKNSLTISRASDIIFTSVYWVAHSPEFPLVMNRQPKTHSWVLTLLENCGILSKTVEKEVEDEQYD